MKHAVGLGSGTVIYISNFIKISSGIQKLIGKIHRQHGDLVGPLVFFFKMRKVA
jgi:hypothetical protein